MGLMMMVGVFPALFSVGAKGWTIIQPTLVSLHAQETGHWLHMPRWAGKSDWSLTHWFCWSSNPGRKSHPSQIIEISLDGLVVLVQYHLLYPLHSTICWSISNHYYCHQGKWGAVFLHFLMLSLGQQLLRDSGLSLTTVLKSCKLMFEPPFSIWQTGPFAMYWETNFHPPRYRVQDDAIHSCGLEKNVFPDENQKNGGATTCRFTSWTKKMVKHSQK